MTTFSRDRWDMAEVVHDAPKIHRCYDELFSLNWRQYKGFEYGTVIRCSCERHFRLEKGNFFTAVWNSLRGRGHVVGGRSIFDHWVEVFL